MINHESHTASNATWIFETVRRRRRSIVGVPAVVGILTLVVALVIPKWYSATTKILPPQQTQSNAVAILGQLGALTGGASQALGIKNPSDIYATMLKSRTVADALIRQFELKELYGQALNVDARRELARNTTINVTREGLITIEFEDKDPKRAAMVANAYVEELRKLTVNLAVSEAGQRRLFFEGQLKKARDDLTSAEVALQKYTKDAGLINPQGQIGLTVAASASLRAQITAKEVQLAGLRAFATDTNPEVQRINKELIGLRTEMAKMEKDSTTTVGDALLPFGRASDVGLEYARKYRNVKYFETLYEVLARQHEIARIDEAKDATLIQVLDSATEPERHSRPRRLLMTALATILAAIIALATAILTDLFQRKSDGTINST